jgi:membrane associated rhomboid family serine protease
MYGLMALNVLAFGYQLLLGRELQSFIETYGVVPAVYFHSAYRAAAGTVHAFTMADRLVPLLTSMFLHGGLLHIGGNLLYLYIFGDNVEDRMGHFRFLAFYVLCGVGGSLAHVVANPESTVPSIGASGAIAGVLGAYLVLYPRARVVALLPIFVFVQLVRVPAMIFLVFWILQQFLMGAMTMGMNTAQSGGVAWWAHIGGFGLGAALVFLFRRPERISRDRDLWWTAQLRR